MILYSPLRHPLCHFVFSVVPSVCGGIVTAGAGPGAIPSVTAGRELRFAEFPTDKVFSRSLASFHFVALDNRPPHKKSLRFAYCCGLLIVEFPLCHPFCHPLCYFVLSVVSSVVSSSPAPRPHTTTTTIATTTI